LSDNDLQLLSQIREFNTLHEFMNDEQLDRALSLVVKLIMKPDVPSSKAPALIVELQALSTKFAIAAATYATIESGPARSDAAHRKNLYFSTKEALNKLVDSLKYSAKANINGMD